MSWLRAERTGAWYVGGNGEIGNVVVTGQPACYDAGRIGQLIRMIGEHNAAWEEWFASFGVQPYLVRYEELDADLAGVTRSILSFLGTRPVRGRRDRAAALAPGRRTQRPVGRALSGRGVGRISPAESPASPRAVIARSAVRIVVPGPIGVRAH
ncbi:Stf0 family sulfotransferase [Streptomyces scopuliridis]|uniref:Stf0 family sulfotransferase n=1 Tax=Streptomyces scopuliridis TaxID=452529 RepID=UPI003CC7F8ED